MAFNPDQPRASNGKWEGAGGDKGGHSAQVNNIGKTLVSPSVVDTIRNNPNGFSVRPTGEQPTKGYMVAVPGRTKILAKDALHGEAAHAIINDYARANADVLSKPGAHIGGWQDKETGKVYLDIANNIPRVRDAVRAGKAGNQIAVWDVKRHREIRTGGSGE